MEGKFGAIDIVLTLNESTIAENLILSVCYNYNGVEGYCHNCIVLLF